MDFLKLIFGGAMIGVAEVIPGVSGGTIAVMINVYDRLIGSINSLRTDFRGSIKFLLPLLIGMGGTILAFSHLLKYLLAEYPMTMNALFIGLVVGIVPMLCRRASTGTHKAYQFVPLIVMFVLMMGLAATNASAGLAGMTVYTQLTVPLALKLLVCGFIAALCMIIPGISGSMIMVIFGMYSTVIGAITDINIPILLCAGIGMLCGVIFGAKLIAYCLKHFPQATYYGILGLVLGSAFSLFAKAGISFATPEGWVALAAVASGFVLSLFFTSEKSLNATVKS